MCYVFVQGHWVVPDEVVHWLKSIVRRQLRTRHSNGVLVGWWIFSLLLGCWLVSCYILGLCSCSMGQTWWTWQLGWLSLDLFDMQTCEM